MVMCPGLRVSAALAFCDTSPSPDTRYVLHGDASDSVGASQCGAE